MNQNNDQVAQLLQEIRDEVRTRLMLFVQEIRLSLRQLCDFRSIEYVATRTFREYGNSNRENFVDQCLICLEALQDKQIVFELACHQTHLFRYKCLSVSIFIIWPTG